MNTYAFLIKAKAKSGAKNLFCWFSAKSDSRAQREIENILEDAEIEVGRGADYQLPVRTNWLVVDDLPAERVLDDTWCDRYELGEDGKSWSQISKAADSINIQDERAQLADDTGNASAPAADAPALLRPVARLRLPQRLIAHLLNDTEEKEISEAVHVQIGAAEADESNIYIQNLLQACREVPGIDELSAHVEWKLIQAVKELFPLEQNHEVSAINGFITAWVEAEAGDRSQLVKEWADIVHDWPEINSTTASATDIVQKLHDAEIPELITVATLPFRQRLLAQFISESEYAYHIQAEQKNALIALEMDVDNSYVQNLLLAAENTPSLKDVREYDLWKLTDAVREVFPQDKKLPELGVMLQFLKAWSETAYVDKGLLVKEWAKGNRISAIQRTDTGTNAGGGIVTDRSQDYTHTLDTLDYEIAAATLPMDFDIYNIPGAIHRRAKEIVQKHESPFKEWSAALRKTAGILDYSRAAIFALIRGAAENVHHFPVSLQTYISANLKEHQHDKPDAATVEAAQFSREALDKQLAADRGEYVEGISDPADPKWDKTPRKTFCTHEENLQRVREEGARRRAEAAAAQPKVENLGAGVFSIEGLTGNTPGNPDNGPVTGDTTYQEMAEGLREELEITEDVQMETAVSNEIPAGTPVSAGEGADADHPQADAVAPSEIFAAAAPSLANHDQENVKQKPENVHQSDDSAHQEAEKVNQIEPEVHQEPPAQEYPAFFEPGRYEGLPNNVYHAANGISSTMVKDARVSLMYFNARHVEKTISREQSKVLDMGNLVHALALQPENLHTEFSIEPEIPEGAFTTTATLRAFIDEYNNGLPVLLSADDIKRFIEEYNATLPAPVPLGDDVAQTGESYMSLPAEYQRVEEGQKVTAAKMKACIKEYNATLPAPVKTSGSRDALLEQLAIINPDLVAQEAQKPQPLKVSGTKADLIQAVKAVKPDAVFADELLDAWRENPEEKILVTRQQLATARAIQSALLAHPTAGKFLSHPGRAVEVSYFGIDEETGLEIRVRPDLEIDMNGIRIGADLKTISMWNVKQSGLRARLHREIIDRDYHLSAAMYTETAALDQFFWIFVNKDEGYHWIAIVEASQELLELGALEYRTTMRAIANAFDTGEWPAPIIDDYTDELSDYDMRRLEALRSLANV
ncbi:PD-(D/E)XK nuclease-like domain-containing protein [Atlantibacter hermannii]|uniref:RecE family exodeoxyribonuclease n=2 Tax=Atlantibacter hermannii TaxID=565 RepID=UPI002DB6137C|nr:RecE family exodeoxyribonuclease [Atlantibacter hermannii]MEB7925441.1 PD-(D/E)XK nuclease-like domain-containing protein [Atlantibacter hermannii]